MTGAANRTTGWMMLHARKFLDRLVTAQCYIPAAENNYRHEGSYTTRPPSQGEWALPLRFWPRQARNPYQR